MRNRIEKLGTFADIKRDNDVIELLKAIKQQVFDANERKAPQFKDGNGMEEADRMLAV